MKKVVHENLRAAGQRLVIILSGGRSDMPGNDCQIEGKQYRTIATHALLESYFAIRTLHYAVLPEKNLNGFPQTEGLLVENKNAWRGDRMLMTVYHGCSSVCGTMQASSSTDCLQVCGGWIYVSPRRDEGIEPYKSL